jgi:hypothetical protein
VGVICVLNEFIQGCYFDCLEKNKVDKFLVFIFYLKFATF